MTTYVLRAGKLVPKHLAEPARVTARGPQIISDDLPSYAMLNHADGKLYTSKAAFRRATRAAGCVEVGNDQQRDTRQVDTSGIREDIARAIGELGG